MKYSQVTGIIAALLLILVCYYIPLSYIASKQITVFGMNARGTSFGKPGIMSIVFSTVSLLFFAIPRIWAKRTNIFICVLNLAWSIRNYILVTSCFMGDCPEKKAGIFLLVLLAFIMLLMSFFPKLEIKQGK